ncbi:hypothetical protein LDO32_13520, partial [Luteimonas sp. Y-2-2-4F]|nr:hypothetical protein [Luteimonas sp. Y-2-2-4F]
VDAARAELRAGDAAAAAATARRALALAPAHGPAFGVLAQALGDADGAEAALARYRIAAQRAPRDVQVRGWLALRALERGDADDALAHFDALLTVSPGNRRQVLSLLARLAGDRAFADALAGHLSRRPPWRGALLRTASQEAPEAADRLHAALRRHGDLSAEETARWLDAMLAGGRWGTAYAYWASGLPTPPRTLPAVYNGDFAGAPTAAGFDWRLRRTPGVVAERRPRPEGGHTMRFVFLGRAVDRVGLEQPLLLAPGHYRLRALARGAGLRASAGGLAWSLACGDGARIARGALMRGDDAWAEAGLEFEVPAAPGCEGQWLRLVNPAPPGMAQILRGELHLAEVAIDPLPGVKKDSPG